ncbi:hypothetical protein D3C79_624190 [compost metagenome]
MQDVAGQVVVAPGNEQLVAGNRVAAVAQRFGTAAQQGKVTAGLRLGQAHGGQACAADDAGQVTRLQWVAAMGLKAQVGAMGDAGVHGPAMVAGKEHLLNRRIQHQRQALAAEPGLTGQRRPAAVHVSPIGRRKAVRCAHPALLQAAALAVARCIQRRQCLFAEAGGLLQHLQGQLEIDVGVGWQVLPLLFGPKPMLQHELHVLQGSLPSHGSPRIQAAKWGFSISTAMPWPPPMQAAAMP